MTGQWQFWIDRGGTFTDIIGLAPDGGVHVGKQPSTDSARALLTGVRQIMREAKATAGIASLRIGTTITTNAMLEGKLAPVALLTTAGLGDALLIGQQHRPDIFARHIVRPDPLYLCCGEIDERVNARGEVLQPLSAASVSAALTVARERGATAIAIVLLHGWRHSRHEAAVASAARDAGFEQVSVSHEVAPLVRYVPRAMATVLDAGAAPVLRQFIGQIAAAAQEIDPACRLYFMQSNGGLAAAAQLRAGDSLLSGPAGGVTAMARLGEALGYGALIGFDMGGTSTDVSLWDGELLRRHTTVVNGVEMASTALDIHTIAAGGGSCIALRDGRISVGPESAGADPGPACYGRGGPATLTDVQLVLGRLQSAYLPSVFGAAADAPVDIEAAHTALSQILQQLPVAARGKDALERFAADCFEVAVAAMANAIRTVAARLGRDPAHFTLFAFGGAAGQHVCRVAAACGMERVLVHPLASVMSALGIGIADEVALRRASIGQPLTLQGQAGLARRLAELEQDARAALDDPSVGSGSIECRRSLELRSGASDTAIAVDYDTPERMRDDFMRLHRERYGFAPAGQGIQVDAASVEVRVRRALPRMAAVTTGEPPRAGSRARLWLDGWQDVPVYGLADAPDGIVGPAMLVDAHTTLIVEPTWRVERRDGAIALARLEQLPAVDARPARSAAAQLEIFHNLFMHVAQQMGAVLAKTAHSVNIKERLDFSCAVFDASGALIANAPHMPVHLGSMGLSVRAIIRQFAADMSVGDAYLLNDPAGGGTHLPDITVVTPVFLTGNPRPEAFVASRAHHADVGGVTPGSMPAFSCRIEEEGVLFTGMRLVAKAELREEEVLGRLASAPHAARNPAQNLADLRAQLAANACGIRELERAAARYGATQLLTQMEAVQENAAEAVAQTLLQLRDGRFQYCMDDGQLIAVAVRIDHEAARAVIDFTGTSSAGAHNLNAPRAVTIAAVLYVLRTMMTHSIPLNDGCLRPVDIVIPSGSMLDPPPGAAVVGGNVETSQCIVDAIFGALGCLAASQGTMNNLTFGNARLQYYETIAGGAGAGPGFDGASGVQTHMTNSRLTDPEILEGQFPVLVRRFALRRGSGGAGRWHGGDGLTRRLEFCSELQGAILSNHRRVAPFGLEGGEPGAIGRNRLWRRDGGCEILPGAAQFAVRAGDALEIETPGGGGFGRQDEAGARRK
ncbi:MAG: hydantoinase B/oxoprolinase family protein [Steroidobacteraceae bacterium]